MGLPKVSCPNMCCRQCHWGILCDRLDLEEAESDYKALALNLKQTIKGHNGEKTITRCVRFHGMGGENHSDCSRKHINWRSRILLSARLDLVDAVNHGVNHRRLRLEMHLLKSVHERNHQSLFNRIRLRKLRDRSQQNLKKITKEKNQILLCLLNFCVLFETVQLLFI